MSDFINIKYDKKDGSLITERKIIPTHIPDDFISAIEVTGLSDMKISEITEQQLAYKKYVELFKRNMFTFDDWVKHNNGDTSLIKYKRFKLNKTTFS